MKRIVILLLLVASAWTGWSQSRPALEQIQADPKKSYGMDYPYLFETQPVTKSPKGYRPFYISHYARHGSRYYWNANLYTELDTLLTAAHAKHLLTPAGEAFHDKFMAAKEELVNGISELSQVGWEQHQRIARTMCERFPEVFRKGGYVFAIASLSGRSVLSMSSFCQELMQCYPNVEIREQSSRFTMNDVAPNEQDNPYRKSFPSPGRPRFEQNRSSFTSDNSLPDKIISRVFVSTEGLPGRPSHIADNLISLYTSLPNIQHEGMMGDIITDQEMMDRWESSNLGSYSWVFGGRNRVIPVMEDIIRKADAVLDGSSDHVADLRFGHDTYLGPLTVLMGINGADLDPEDPYEVKNCYQNWQTCMAGNIQLIFYRGKKADDDILVKCLLNGTEATLPAETDIFPYYKWSDLRALYAARCASVTPR